MSTRPSLPPATVADTTADSSPTFITREEYHATRGRQDRHIITEFDSLRTSIDQVKGEVKEFQDDVKSEFKEMNDRFDRLEAESRRTHAYFRNKTLENPILEIQPLVVYHPGKGILEPTPSLFPRHAKDFYALKNPLSTRQFDTLLYLANFYDVHLPHFSESSDDQSSGNEPTISRPDLLVEILEHILGLEEERFKKFAERAKEQPHRLQARPVKRLLLPTEESKGQRRRLEIRSAHPRSSPRTISSDGLTTGNVEWKARSTLSPEGPTVNGLRKRYKEMQQAPKEETETPPEAETEPGDSDGSTRAFTHPRPGSP